MNSLLAEFTMNLSSASSRDVALYTAAVTVQLTSCKFFCKAIDDDEFLKTATYSFCLVVEQNHACIQIITRKSIQLFLI